MISDSEYVNLILNEIVNSSVWVNCPTQATIWQNRIINPPGWLRRILVEGVGANLTDEEKQQIGFGANLFDNWVENGLIECAEDSFDYSFARGNIALDIIGCPGQLGEPGIGELGDPGGQF